MYNLPLINNTIQYVNDEQSACNYQMGTNQEVILMDRNEDVFYIKRTDASGSYTVDAYDFKKRVKKQVEYATKEDIQGIMEQIESLKKGLANEQPIIEQQHQATST